MTDEAKEREDPERPGPLAKAGARARGKPADAGAAPSPAGRRSLWEETKAHFKGRPEPLNALVLTLPLLLFYEIGSLFIDLKNGVDLLSMALAATFAVSPLLYWGLKAALILFFAGLVWYLRREGSLRPAALLPTLLESTVYAFACAYVASWVIRNLHLADAGRPSEPHSIGFFAGLVMSLGAGFWEEVVFRGGLLNGLVWVAKKTGKLKPWLGLVLAIVVSSLVFSGVHYVGALGDSFQLGSFVFRFVLGVLLALIFRYRGFAVAAYTHALYDVLVTFLQAVLR